MKTVFTIAILLFVYPWQTKEEQPVYENVYTITGRSYDENGQTSYEPCFAMEIYIKFYQDKILVANTIIGSMDVEKREYRLSQTTNGIRTFTSEKYSEYYLTDKDYEVQKVNIIKPYETYGGNITTKFFFRGYQRQSYSRSNKAL